MDLKFDYHYHSSGSLSIPNYCAQRVNKVVSDRKEVYSGEQDEVVPWKIIREN
jgi:hypothetical protein